MVCVQKLFGKLGERLAEEVTVAGCHVGILMTEANLRTVIERAQHRGPFVRKLNAIMDGLSAAANAAARACHDLDEIIVRNAALQRIEQLAGICQAMGHCHAKLATVEVEGSLAPTIGAADLQLGFIWTILIGKRLDVTK